MVRTVRALIRRPAADCFARFCDVCRLPEWVPELESAEAVLVDEDNRAVEVRFRAAGVDGRTYEYTLLYAYDASRRRVAWMPGADASWAVRGYAAFDEHEGGCQMTYALELGPGRAESETVGTEVEDAFAAFRRWVESSD